MSEDLVQCVRTAGFEMEYAKFGNGPRALVIIPGLAIKSVMKSAASLQVPYKMFTEGYTLYFFDRRKDVDPGYSLEEMACDQVLAMQALGLKDVALYGVSQGTPAAFNRATILSEATGRTTRSSLAASTSTSWSCARARRAHSPITLSCSGSGFDVEQPRTSFHTSSGCVAAICWATMPPCETQAVKIAWAAAADGLEANDADGEAFSFTTVKA